MGIDTIEKIKQLPVEKQQEVDDFIDFLINKYQSNDTTASIGELRKKNAGWAKEKIWIADDFNETPEDFKEYI